MNRFTVDLAWTSFVRLAGGISRRIVGLEFDQVMSLGCAVVARFEASPFVSMTFDDSPRPGTTSLILKALARHALPSTFFCIGENAGRHPEIVRDILTAGHEIGNHSEHHLDLHRASPQRLRREILDCQNTLSEVCGEAPRLFRAPYGHFRWDMRGLRQAAALDACVGWDVGPPAGASDADTIASWVIKHARPGSIIVLHDGLHGADSAASEAVGRAAAASLDTIVPELRRRGLRFRTLGQQLSAS